eukprot:m.531440 g.531440  ORF g.531440 m.531440 type:complete len:59 (-) comp22035_c0_seq2:289-465(-)
MRSTFRRMVGFTCLTERIGGILATGRLFPNVQSWIVGGCIHHKTSESAAYFDVTRASL